MSKVLSPEVDCSQDNYLMPKTMGKKAVNVNSIEAITKETDKTVTGTFIHVQYPGQSKYIHCRYYEGQIPFSKNLMDGEVYTVPLSVARHINERVFEIEHSNLLDSQGNAMKSEKKKHHTRFLYNGA